MQFVNPAATLFAVMKFTTGKSLWNSYFVGIIQELEALFK
jgi:hypothetical protein